mgnify:CR=1 FL=1|jgi:hypothetical protein
MDLKFKIIQDLHERKGGGYIKNTLMSLGIGIIALFVVDIPNPLIRLVCLFILFFGMVGIFFNLILYTMESSLLDEIKEQSQRYDFYLIDTKIRKPNYKKVSIDLTFKNSQGLFKDTIMQDTTAYARHFERLDKEDLKAKVFRAYLKDDTLIMLESEIISKLH